MVLSLFSHTPHIRFPVNIWEQQQPEVTGLNDQPIDVTDGIAPYLKRYGRKILVFIETSGMAILLLSRAENRM
jgi:hypothetical protein